MERDSIKWLIAGLAGALFTFLLFIGVGVAIFLRMEKSAPEESLASIFDDIHLDVSDEEEAAREEEEERKAAEEDARRDAENAAWEERLGLKEIYTPVYLLKPTHNQLYHDKNFKLIEEQLAAELANTATPFDRFRYSCSVEDLTEVHNEDLQALIAVTDEWATASPESHYPYLLRGKLNSELAWEYRGDGFIGEVSRSGLRKFEQLNKRAKEDLEIAQKLNPNDPEVPAALADAVAPIEGMRALRRCYDQTLALNPHHVHVRYTMMTYLQPQWYGDWRKFDAYMADIDVAAEAFPYLFTVRRDGYSLMEAKGKEYEGVWDSPETYRKAAAAFKAQAEQNPEELTVLASAAYFATRADDLASAVGFFERIGNRYPVCDEFPSMLGYHGWRIHAMVEHSDDPGIVGTPREKELLDAALALDVEGVKANGFYMAYLTRLRDDVQTKAWWDSLDGGYYKTSDLGASPNYDILQAMYLASHSDDFGVQGSDQEQPTLDQALALAPDNAYVRLVYAEYHITRDQFDEARIHLERAREVDPAYLPALLTMGWLNYHQKRYDDAIAAANQFLSSGTSKYAVMNAFDAKEIVELSTKKKAAAAAPNLNATG
jgi:hypothetical protein